GGLAVIGHREAQVHQVAAVLPSARDERHRHPDGNLVVVPRPAAIEVEAHVPEWLPEHAVDEIIAVRKGARHAAGAAEDVGVLPDGIERDDAAERGAPDGAVPAVPAHANAAALDLGHDLLS